jgi:hypothetical protein
MTTKPLPIEQTTPTAGTQTAALTGALRGHYLKPGEPYPGGAFLTELTDDKTARRVDALHIGFWQSSGNKIDGHEVKTARSDWLRELKDPTKCGPWFERCHRWWLVVPSTAVARPDELPDGWGLMVPGTRGRRFRVLVPAAERQPTIDLPFLLILAKRLDSDRGRAAAERDTHRRDADRARESERRAQETAREAGSDETRVRLQLLDRVEEAFGQQITTGWIDENRVTAGYAGAALRAWADLTRAEAHLGLAGQGTLDRLDQSLQQATSALNSYADAIARVRAATPTTGNQL